MRWLCIILEEPLKDGKKMIRKWNTKDKLTDLYCTRKFNVKGRYMSILSLQGMKDRS